MLLAYPVVLVAFYLLPAFPAIESAFLQDEVYGLVAYAYSGSVLQISPLTGLLLLGIELAAIVGLYSLHAHARTLFLLVCVFYVALGFLSGMYVATPVGSALAYVIDLFHGGILFAAYMSPMRHRFQ